MTILNFTQHVATADQRAAGVEDLSPAGRDTVVAALTFEQLPSADLIVARAQSLASLAEYLGAEAVMIGGAGYLMPALEHELRQRGIRPLHAFSVRASEDQAQPDGSVKKVTVFRHLGFVETPHYRGFRAE